MNSVSLVFEALNGCRMSCTGCRIDKDASQLPSNEVLLKLAHLFSGLRLAGTALHEIELGPSDLLSASNREALFENQTLLEFMNLFTMLTFSASFIYPDPSVYTWLADKLRPHPVANKIRVIVPLEMKQVFNDKYISRIKENLKLFRESHKTGIYSTAFNIVFDERYLRDPLNKFSYEQLFSRTNDLVEDEELKKNNLRIDFVFHHGRSRFSHPELTRGFVDSLKELYNHYDRDHQSRHGGIKAGQIPAFAKFDEENNELVFHQDELYIRPVLNDRLSVFHERLKYTGPWMGVPLQDHLTERFNDNLLMATEMKDCSACSHIVECAGRFTQDLMKILGTQECVTLLKRYTS